MSRFLSLVAAIAIFASGGMALGGMAFAQDFPSRAVKLMVPYPPGGGVDGLARPLADRLSRIWGQPVVIENKPGASTMLGGADVARAAPDGHTLFFTTDSSITSNPHLFKKMTYDPGKELTPVTQLIDLHQLVLLHPSVPANTMQELVALAKQKPNTLNYGSYGIGSQPHLLFEMLRKETGAQIQQVPYRGIALALTAVLANEVQMTLGGISVAAGHLKNKTMKPLAISRRERLRAYPDVPTLAEAGFPNVDPRSWYGLFAPAGAPPAVVEKIQRDVAAVFAEPEFKARFIDGLAYTSVASTPAAFAKFIAEDMEYKRNLIAVTGITAE
jgi:tripartite-type tricarboxylate transporter receptor subunit TctC